MTPANAQNCTSGAPARVLAILGTRPEAIKLLPVIQELRRDGRVAPTIVSTGQHREMTRQILSPFGIGLDRDLDIMTHGQSLNEIVGRVMRQVDALYDDLAPEIVVVQGDTTSAYVAALAAFHREIPVAHVEAGLRSNDRRHPFPEEVNRRMISVVCDLHLAPTAASAEHLTREGVPAKDVVVTGNTVVDALLLILADPALSRATLPDGLNPADDRPLVLITLHRREAWLASSAGPAGRASVLELILDAIRQAAARHANHVFVYPVHPNPNVRAPARKILDGLDNVLLVDPQPYFSFVRLMAMAHAILTDSGGIQEEAPSLGCPVLVLRKTTERPEGIAAGTSKLVGTEPAEILRTLADVLSRPPPDPGKRPYSNPFGDGRAAVRVRDALLHRLGKGPAAAPFCFPSASEIPAGGTIPAIDN